MEIIYSLISLILLIALCFYIAKNLAGLAELIHQGSKLTKQEKKGLKFLKSKNCLYSFIIVSFVFMSISGLVFDTWQTRVFFSVCSILLIANFFMDITVKLLPDVFTLSLLWVALIGSALGLTYMEPSQAIITAASLYIVFSIIDSIGELIIKRTALGGGDIKIMAAFGALFGFMQSINLLILGCLIMIIFVSIFKLLGKSHDRELPFGLGLTTAAMVNIYFPGIITNMIEYLIV